MLSTWWAMFPGRRSVCGTLDVENPWLRKAVW